MKKIPKKLAKSFFDAPLSKQANFVLVCLLALFIILTYALGTIMFYLAIGAIAVLVLRAAYKMTKEFLSYLWDDYLTKLFFFIDR